MLFTFGFYHFKNVSLEEERQVWSQLSQWPNHVIPMASDALGPKKTCSDKLAFLKEVAVKQWIVFWEVTTPQKDLFHYHNLNHLVQ